jgi:hypothetical protein
MASADPAEAENGTEVTISVSSESGLTNVMADASEIGGAAASGESGLTVTADASEIGAAAAVSLGESTDTAGSYSGKVTVAGVMESGAGHGCQCH